MNFEVIRPSTYLYDVIVKQNNNSTNNFQIHSNYGFYYGQVNESMCKEGYGVFLYPTSTFLGNWKNDQKFGEGVLVINDGYRHRFDCGNGNTSVIPPSLNIQSLVSPNKGAHLEHSPVIGNNYSYSTVARIGETFATVEKAMMDVTMPQYITSRNYYSGKWQNGKANGIGSFHFSQDQSTHQDFWRNGVAIRYINQNQLNSIAATSAADVATSDAQQQTQQQQQVERMLQNEELKKMLEDWKKVIGTDDDFPISRPYLGNIAIQDSSSPMASSESGGSNLAESRPMLKPTKSTREQFSLSSISSSSTPTSPASEVKSPGASTLLMQSSPPAVNLTSQLIQQSTSSPSQIHIQALSQSTPSQLNIQQQQQQQTNNTSKQSFGVITSSYLKNRIENEEKFFIALIMFISKWELPLNAMLPNGASSTPGNMMQSSGSVTPNFMIVVPDIETATFLPLSSLVMRCNIMEKMIHRLLTDPETRSTLSHHVHQENNSGAGASIVSTTRDERELNKLIPFCIEVEATEDSNSIQRFNIDPIITNLKLFTKPITDFNSVPSFLVHYICDMVSAFKKDKPFELYFLGNRFQTVQEQFIQLITKLETYNKTISEKMIQNQNQNQNTRQQLTKQQQQQPPQMIRQPSSAKGVANVNPNGTKKVVSSTNVGNTKPQTNNLTTVTSAGTPAATPDSPNNNMGRKPPLTIQKQTTIDNINKFNIAEQEKYKAFANSSMLKKQYLDKSTLDFVYNLFRSSFVMPNALENSTQLLNSITTNINSLKYALRKRIKLFREAAQVDVLSVGTESQANLNNILTFNMAFCKDYMKLKDKQIQQFIESQERELALFDHTVDVCDKICKVLFKQLLHITIKRLTVATNFIQRIRSAVSTTSKDPLITPEYILKFVKHIYNISSKLLKICSQPVLANEKDLLSNIKQFMTQQNDLFSLIPQNAWVHTTPTNPAPVTSNALSPAVTSAAVSTPDKSSPSTSGFSLGGLMGIFSKKNLDFFMNEPNGANEQSSGSNSSFSANDSSKPAMEPIALARSLEGLSTSSDTSFNTSLTIITPLIKLSVEIIQGNYHLIPILSTCGDEMTISYLTTILAETRSSLKEKPIESINYLVNVLLQTTLTCPFKSYRCEVFKTIAPLVKIYKLKDELFQKNKDLLKTLMETCIKDDALIFAPHYCMFLANACDDLSVKSKQEFIDLFGVQVFIELMEKGNSKIAVAGADVLRAQAAQILIHLAKTSDNCLADIKNRGGLGTILDLCKLGQVFSHTKIEESDLVIGEFLGAGALARVNRAFWSGKEVAVKIFNEGSFSFRLEDFLKEVAIMGLINHPCLLKLVGACIIPRNLDSTFMIVTEIMHKGTLLDVIKKNHPLSYITIVKHALSVTKGLAYLHSIDMIHRDIKAANILVDKHDVAKVGDFGLSRIVSNINMTAVAGTPKWEAPECLSGESYTSAADVYSFGMMMYEMVTGEEPYPEIQTIVELVRTVYENKKKPKIPSSVHHSLSSLIKECLSHTPKKRPTMLQIKAKLEDALENPPKSY